MADTPRIPTGRTKEPTHEEPKDPTDVGNDQYAGMNRGANFQPRNAGEVEDSLDAAAARVARDINERTRPADNPGPSQDTSWEARVERGEEWVEQEDKDPIRNRDINEDVYPREAPADERDETPASAPGRPGRRR